MIHGKRKYSRGDVIEWGLHLVLVLIYSSCIFVVSRSYENQLYNLEITSQYFWKIKDNMEVCMGWRFSAQQTWAGPPERCWPKDSHSRSSKRTAGKYKWWPRVNVSRVLVLGTTWFQVLVHVLGHIWRKEYAHSVCRFLRIPEEHMQEHPLSAVWVKLTFYNSRPESGILETASSSPQGFFLIWRLGQHTGSSPANVAQETVVVPGQDGKLLHQLLLSLGRELDTSKQACCLSVSNECRDICVGKTHWLSFLFPQV